MMFFLIAYSSRKAGISVTTVASKMSVIFPIIFSLIIDTNDQLSNIKTVAIICTLAGVAITVYKPRKGSFEPCNGLYSSGSFFWNGIGRFIGKICTVQFRG